MKRIVLMAAVVAVSGALASTAFAATKNVALISDGASFVSASSSGWAEVQQSGLSAPAGSQTTMQDNLLTTSPTGWLSNGDTRYFFSQLDTDQYVIINLGKDYNLSGFGATWSPTDRAAADLTVYYSATATGPWTLIGSASAPGSDTVTGAVTAEYIKYDFGAASQQYAHNPPFGGSGINEVYATMTVPESSTWAMMMLGFAGLGFAGYRASLKSVPRARALL
jgi:hypothetical protein